MDERDGMATMVETVRELAAGARQAARWLAGTSSRERDELLGAMADELLGATEAILAANSQDLAEAADRPAAFRDRLTLTPERVAQMAGALRQVADRPDPLDRKSTRLNSSHVK